MHHQDSIVDLVKSNRPISARPLIEASIRGRWLAVNENHVLVEKTIEYLEREKDEFPHILVFGAIFTNCKLVPKRVEFLNMLHKEQVKGIQ